MWGRYEPLIGHRRSQEFVLGSLTSEAPKAPTSRRVRRREGEGIIGPPSGYAYVVLCGLSYSSCLVYLDDVIVFGSSFDEQLARLGQVFDRLAQAN